MPRTRILPALLVLALSVCFASTVDARRRHHGYYGYGERGLARSLDEWRARPAQRQNEQSHNRNQARTAERAETALPRGRSGPFGVAIEKIVRGCAVQGAEFENWPFEAISRSVGADETQNKALDDLREAAKLAAQRLAADCPQEVPAVPAVRLEAAEQGIAATLAAYDIIEPKLAAFYAALNDEQKARLYRDMAASADSSRPDRGFAQAREAAPRELAPRRVASPGFTGTCEELGGVLRNWPVREIERDVRLSDAQRIALYEFLTTSLKAAETLSSTCPAEAALTAVGRMETMRKRLAAVSAATATIRPALARFYEALDQGQKVRFAGMS
jgi:LTXXQ motif family protein